MRSGADRPCEWEAEDDEREERRRERRERRGHWLRFTVVLALFILLVWVVR